MIFVWPSIFADGFDGDSIGVGGGHPKGVPREVRGNILLDSTGRSDFNQTIY